MTINTNQEHPRLGVHADLHNLLAMLMLTLLPKLLPTSQMLLRPLLLSLQSQLPLKLIKLSSRAINQEFLTAASAAPHLTMVYSLLVMELMLLLESIT